MPIYEYLCRACDERFSRLRPVPERDEPAQCPKCGRKESQRIVSVVAAHTCAPDG
ncbi:MAG TPA: zinc ribbon domain-containing protein [Armatimonadota bacterium]|nr:zinc ribbon domain-containing protein [Armatimonadota bacterium]